MMSSKKDLCTFNLLTLLSKHPTTYGVFYKQLGYSHTTVQASIRYLLEYRFIEKGYKITKKGIGLLEILNKLTTHLSLKIKK